MEFSKSIFLVIALVFNLERFWCIQVPPTICFLKLQNAGQFLVMSSLFQVKDGKFILLITTNSDSTNTLTE